MHKKSSWLIRKLGDQYTSLAKRDGYRCRSAYKLIEIDKKFRIFKKNKAQGILDIGCHPGGWLQVIKANSSNESKVVGIDLKEMKQPVSNVEFIHGDFLENFTTEQALLKLCGKLDIILSDMATNSTGDSKIDQIRNFELVDAVINFALSNLKYGGALIIKMMCGNDEKCIIEKARLHFQSVKIYKPDSSYNNSAEKYLIALSKHKSHAIY